MAAHHPAETDAHHAEICAHPAEIRVQQQLDAYRDFADAAEGTKPVLYGLNDLAPVGEAEVGCQHLSTRHYFAKPSRAGSMREFRRRFRAAWPALADFDLAAHSLVMAGGAPAALLQYEEEVAPNLCGDVDLFALAPPGPEGRAAVLAAVRALGDHLLRASGVPYGLAIARTQNAFTFVLMGGSVSLRQTRRGRAMVAMPLVIQVIFRPYHSIADVLYGFDLGSCAVAYDGSALSFSPAGRYSAERMANMVDLSMWRPSYDARLLKYYRRGYGVAFTGAPEGFRLTRDHREVGSLSVQKFSDESWMTPSDEAAVPSEYEPFALNYTNPSSLRVGNVMAAARGHLGCLCAYTAYVPDLDLEAFRPTIGPDDVVCTVRKILGVEKMISVARIELLTEVLGPDAAAELAVALVRCGFDMTTGELLKFTAGCHEPLQKVAEGWASDFEPRPIRPEGGGLASAEWYGLAGA